MKNMIRVIVAVASIFSCQTLWAQESALALTEGQPYYNGSRMREPNDWRMITARAEMGERYALAVQTMRMAVKEGNKTKAQEAFGHSVALSPEVAPYREWADFLAEQGDVQGALALYQLVLDSPGKYYGTREGSFAIVTLMRYCLLLLQTGNVAEGSKAYKSGLEMTKIFVTINEWRDHFTLKPTNQIVDTKTMQAAAYTIIGLTNQEARTADEERVPPDIAVAQYQKALAAKPDFDLARIFLGDAHEKSSSVKEGSFEKAIAAWEVAERSTDKKVRDKAQELLRARGR